MPRPGHLRRRGRHPSLPFAVACALIEKESGGRNVVLEKGQQSNGVGPCQITYKGHFPAMEAKGLKPWRAADCESERHARYNGSLDYGADLARRIDVWKERFK